MDLILYHFWMILYFSLVKTLIFMTVLFEFFASDDMNAFNRFLNVVHSKWTRVANTKLIIRNVFIVKREILNTSRTARFTKELFIHIFHSFHLVHLLPLILRGYQWVRRMSFFRMICSFLQQLFQEEELNWNQLLFFIFSCCCGLCWPTLETLMSFLKTLKWIKSAEVV